mmetsp:Transcript_38275/g.101587  ORF Transcript_38275/g.101587 Transcript_38275/m.101587 type:complete len:225 (+) Transcript_38275:130-804(+)
MEQGRGIVCAESDFIREHLADLQFLHCCHQPGRRADRAQRLDLCFSPDAGLAECDDGLPRHGLEYRLDGPQRRPARPVRRAGHVHPFRRLPSWHPGHTELPLSLRPGQHHFGVRAHQHPALGGLRFELDDNGAHGDNVQLHFGHVVVPSVELQRRLVDPVQRPGQLQHQPCVGLHRRLLRHLPQHVICRQQPRVRPERAQHYPHHHARGGHWYVDPDAVDATGQ